MDKIALIRKEIERRIRELDEQIVDIYDSKAVLRKDELQRLLSFLDTLKEEPDKSMEEEIKKEMVKLPYYLPSWYRKRQRRDKENTKMKEKKNERSTTSGI